MKADISATTDLLLLIGSNPLPNYVVANCFLDKCKQLRNLWLVVSAPNNLQAGTGHLAANLDRVLRNKYSGSNKPPFSTRIISLSDVSNAMVIAREFRAGFGQLRSDSTRQIHLNYTGGTKVMSLHVYRQFTEFLDMAAKPHQFSYLDGRNFRLINDNEDVIASQLHKDISITLDELTSLHGFEKIRGQSYQSTVEALDAMTFRDAVERFSLAIETGALDGYYAEDSGYVRSRFLTSRGNLAMRPGEWVESNLKDYVASGLLLEINNLMLQDARLFKYDGQLDWDISNNSCKKAIRFLDGLWLECYVEKCLREAFPQNPAIEKMHSGVELRKSHWQGQSRFELDLAVLNGYQLFGVSITTSNEKHLCKNKAFEIIHRTRQIGGDEAKAVLVCRASESNCLALQQEMLYETGQPKDHFLVLGAGDLPRQTLIEKLRAFFFNN